MEPGNAQLPTPNSQEARCRGNGLPWELEVGSWELTDPMLKAECPMLNVRRLVLGIEH
jgi:hypothetical protein